MHIDQYDGSMKLSKSKRLVKLERFLLNCVVNYQRYTACGQLKIGGMILTPKNLKCSQNNVSQWQSVHHTTHMNIPGIMPRLPRSEDHYIYRRI